MTRPPFLSAMFLLSTSIAAQIAFADNAAPATPQRALVDVTWIQARIDSPRVCILELGPDIRRYRQGHIPGARFVHWVDDITEPADQARYTVAPPEMIEALLCRLGVQNDTTIVLYDDLNSRVSARMFWTLRYYGHKEIRILDGGRNAWPTAGQEFVTETTRVEPREYKIVSTLKKHRICLKQLRNQLGKPGISIIDGRPAAQYTGEEPGKVYHTGKAHDQRGHIPGAVNILWTDNFREDGTFRSPAELSQMYEDHGVTRSHRVIAYCNEGLHAAPVWFVLTELLGYDKVQVYDESMAQWANDRELPVRQGDQP